MHLLSPQELRIHVDIKHNWKKATTVVNLLTCVTEVFARKEHTTSDLTYQKHSPILIYQHRRLSNKLSNWEEQVPSLFAQIMNLGVVVVFAVMGINRYQSITLHAIYSPFHTNTQAKQLSNDFPDVRQSGENYCLTRVGNHSN